MIPIYKSGGPHEKDGISYSFMAVSRSDLDQYKTNGWVDKLDDLMIIEADYEEIKEEGSDYEEKLRAEIKALGGKPAGRSSIKTLEKQLAELQV